VKSYCNVGDVIASDDDIHGDGVNVAARLEALAEPGGVLVSATVHATAANRLPCLFDDLGERSLKNIEKPVRVYRVGGFKEVSKRPALPLPDKPSIAVLPFQNMSGDPEQEYFADGMVEDITTALSRIGGLFVIARNSSFTYKGRAVDMKQVGRELGVPYVLEGSVRKSGGRVRITCQLINALTGTHILADRFDSSLEDIFELQDRVTECIAGAIEPSLRNAEIARASNKPTLGSIYASRPRRGADAPSAGLGAGSSLRSGQSPCRRLPCAYGDQRLVSSRRCRGCRSHSPCSSSAGDIERRPHDAVDGGSRGWRPRPASKPEERHSIVQWRSVGGDISGMIRQSVADALADGFDRRRHSAAYWFHLGSASDSPAVDQANEVAKPAKAGVWIGRRRRPKSPNKHVISRGCRRQGGVKARRRFPLLHFPVSCCYTRASPARILIESGSETLQVAP
jgi:TolB-like protein